MDYESAQNTLEYQRKKMVEQDLKPRGIGEAGVLSVMGRLAREEFVSAAYRSQAYADGPLPIGMGQTISQPYIVALMTQELRLNNFCEVLEVGTGSGYQTAILAKLSRQVYTIERFSELGIIVAPVGETGWQQLIVGVKKEGKLNEQTVCGVRFVKLIGQYAFKE
jgi:protein-L-isoaspartate(D-aspartate) O-methyltransferase